MCIKGDSNRLRDSKHAEEPTCSGREGDAVGASFVDGREADGQRDLAGTLVVAGHNFGIGSSRETGARVFLLAGVQAIVAASFARIFYRNVMNLGLPAVVCPALANERPVDGETVSLDLEASVLRIGDRELPTLAWDPHWQRICDAGGLAAWLGLSSSSRKDTTS